MATQDKDLTSEEVLRLLTLAVWKANDGDCPPERIPTFRQLDDLISTTAWGEDARQEATTTPCPSVQHAPSTPEGS